MDGDRHPACAPGAKYARLQAATCAARESKTRADSADKSCRAGARSALPSGLAASACAGAECPRPNLLLNIKLGVELGAKCVDLRVNLGVKRGSDGVDLGAEPVPERVDLGADHQHNHDRHPDHGNKQRE